VSESSIWALGSHRASVPGTVAALLAVATNNACGNGMAAWALGEIGEAPDSVIPFLTEGLRSANRDLRLGCAAGLGEFGRKAQTAVPALREALEGSDQSLRKFAAHSLDEIGVNATPLKK